MPAKGTAAIVNRPGYHNLLGVDNIGRICYSIYGADKATRQVLYSKTKVKAGDKIQIASVIEKVDEEEFDIILYINGVDESRKTMYRAIFPYNRDNFSIHGGKTPGSSGCIDLTKDIQNFTQWFEKNGFDVIVHVKY